MKTVKYVVHIIVCAKDVREYDAKNDICASEGRGNRGLEELLDLHCSPNIIRVIKLRRKRREGHVARMGEKRGKYRVLVGETEGRRPFGRPRRRWKNSNKMDLKEVIWGPWTRLMWLRIGTGRVGGVCPCKCRFRKTRGISGLAEDTLFSQEGLCSLRPVTCLVMYKVVQI